MAERTVPLFSIGAVARMLDLSAATIRTWETRYGYVVPQRSKGGQRLYSRDQVDQLRAFSRAYLVLDTDDAGFEATLALYDAIGPTAIPVALPDDVKDPAELASRPDGQAVFAEALLKAVGKPAPDEAFDSAPEADL